MEYEEMNLAELLKQTTEENQTRKILAILEESEDLEKAKEKVKALLKELSRAINNKHTQGRHFLTFLLSRPSDKKIIAGS